MNKPRIYIGSCLASLLLLGACHEDSTKVLQTKSVSNAAVDSVAFYESKLQADSLNLDLRFALATNCYADRKFDKAIEHLKVLCRIDSRNKEVWITLGNVYYDISRFEDAIQVYEKALEMDSKNLNVRCDLATCYQNIKKFEQAIKLLRQNLSIDNNHVQSHHNLSVIYSNMNKPKEAEAEMKIYNQLNSKK